MKKYKVTCILPIKANTEEIAQEAFLEYITLAVKYKNVTAGFQFKEIKKKKK